MKNNLFYSLLAVCLVMLVSCQQAPEMPVAAATVEAPAPPNMAALKAEIQALNNTWSAASNANDVATILTFYADDAVSMADDKPMSVGKAAIQKVLEAELANRKDGITVSYETLDVFGDENLLTETRKVTSKDAAGKVTYTGKYMELWEKRNGKWQVIREIYNDDAK